MKLSDYTWEHPALESYQKTIPANQFLFRQTEPAKSVFIVTKGVVQLLSQKEGKELVVGNVCAGEFLGEKAVVGGGPHKRYLSARTLCEVECLELDTEAFQKLENTEPDLHRDMLKQMFVLAAKRLDESNRLVAAIRPSDNILRFLNLICHYAEVTGRKTPRGFEFKLSPDQLRANIDMTSFEIEECLKSLVKQGPLQLLSEGVYCLVDKPALKNLAPVLKESLPTIDRI